MEKWASIRASSSAMTDLMQCVNDDYCAFLIRDSKFKATMRCHNTIAAKNARRIPIRFFCLCFALPSPTWMQMRFVPMCSIVFGRWLTRSIVKAESNFFPSLLALFSGTIEFHRAKQIGLSRAQNYYSRSSRLKNKIDSREHTTRPSPWSFFFRSKTKQNRQRETKKEEIAKFRGWLHSNRSKTIRVVRFFHFLFFSVRVALFFLLFRRRFQLLRQFSIL